MKIEKIKPIPQYILARIKKRDKEAHIYSQGKTRFYSYLTTNDKELVKVTVAVKYKDGNWYYKQCAVHGIHSDKCLAKDIACFYMCGYTVGWFDEGLQKRPKWYEDGEWYWNDDKLFDPFAPIVNKEYIAKFPEYKYSAYELYSGEDILQYLRIYEKYPQAEYLVKLGLMEYAKNKQILKKAGEDKRFRKYLSANRKEIKSNLYYISTVLQAYQKNKPLAEIQFYESKKKQLCREKGFAPIRELLKGDYKEYFDYIYKQKISNYLYLDYLNACNYLGLDMSEEKNRFPHDFKHWHDIRIDEYSTAKALKDEEERKELYSKFALIANKYMPLQDEKKGEFIAVIAKSPDDLIREGNILGHCVGRMGYDQKFIKEKTLIFFIRSRELPDTPLVTLEYSLENRKVLQCYAKGNTPPDNAVMYYVNDIWLPYANRTLKRIVA